MAGQQVNISLTGIESPGACILLEYLSCESCEEHREMQERICQQTVQP